MLQIPPDTPATITVLGLPKKHQKRYGVEDEHCTAIFKRNEDGKVTYLAIQSDDKVTVLSVEECRELFMRGVRVDLETVKLIS